MYTSWLARPGTEKNYRIMPDFFGNLKMMFTFALLK